MRISDKVEMLELQTTLANGPGTIHPLFVWDEQDAVLFDTGLPDTGPALKEAALTAGVPLEKLSTILITHSDMDHVGCLAQMLSESGRSLKVLAHKDEKPFIECELPPVRLRQMEDGVRMATGAMRDQLISLCEGLKRSYKTYRVLVDATVEDGEVLPVCGGITCIHTPGHTPGHMCYYVNALNLLVAGDLLQVQHGTLERCPDFTVLDKGALIASMKKLTSYNIQMAVCFHGGLYRGDISRRVAEIIDGLTQTL